MRLFISYSHEDAAFAARLETDLQRAGADIWIDHERLQPGTDDWDAAIRAGISRANAIIYIASPSGASSRFVRDELGLARGRGRRVIPIWLSGNDWHDAAPLGWGSTQYIDARTFRYAAALDELLRTLGLAAPAPSPVAAPVHAPLDPFSAASPPTATTPGRLSIDPMPASNPTTEAPAGTRSALSPVKPAIPATPQPSTIPPSPPPGHRPAAPTRRPRRWRLVLASALAIVVVAATTLTILSKVIAPSGSVRWKTRIGGDALSSPAVADGMIYFGADYLGSDDSHFYALDAGSGAVRWKTPAGGVGESSPAVANGVVYVGSDDGYVYAIAA